MRNTMQADGPYYRGHLSPFNVKHGMVDPSHTHMNPADDHEHKDMNFSAYDWKKGRDKYAKQHGTYEHGRRLEDAKGILGITIGRNYYAYSALGAMANGIQLDSSEKYESLENAYRIKIVINYNCGPYQQHNEFNSLTR